MFIVVEKGNEPIEKKLFLYTIIPSFFLIINVQIVCRSTARRRLIYVYTLTLTVRFQALQEPLVL